MNERQVPDLVDILDTNLTSTYSLSSQSSIESADRCVGSSHSFEVLPDLFKPKPKVSKQI
jgi:hypothetical protein